MEGLEKTIQGFRTLENEEPNKKQLLEELKEAARELNLVEQDKLEARPAKEL
jgi:cell shape-determining protein MreC